jgi:hypothetical protein
MLAKLNTGDNDALDVTFAPVVYGLSVNSLAVYNNILILGGNFTKVNGSPRTNLAAINKNTGELLSWNPVISNAVLAVAVQGNVLVVSIDESTRGNNLVSFDLSNLGVTTKRSWLTDLEDGKIFSLFSLGTSDVLVGGSFRYLTSSDAEWRRRVASVSIDSNESNHAIIRPFNPRACFGNVNSVVAVGSQIFLGGEFMGDSDLGQYGIGCYYDPALPNSDKKFLARIVDEDPNDSAFSVSPWNPNPDGYISHLSIGTHTAGSTLLVSGTFSTISGYPRNGLAAFSTPDPTSDPTLVDWSPEVLSGMSSGNVKAMIQMGSKVYLGGDFNKIKIDGQETEAFFFGSINAPP